MKRLKFGLRVAAVCMMVATAWGQITITQSSFGPVGYAWTQYSTTTPIQVSTGPSGANQTWTIPTVTWGYTLPTQWVNPASTPYGSSFPTANIANDVNFGGTHSYAYMQLSATEVRQLGIASDISGGASVYNPTALVSPLPMSYPHDPWTSVSEWILVVGGFHSHTRDSVIRTVDGWGTVNTQYGSFQVLRIFEHRWSTTWLEEFPNPQTAQNVSYSWTNSQGIAMVAMTAPGSDPNFTVGSVSMSELTTAADPVRGPVAERFKVEQNFPNPFNPQTTMPLSLDQPARVSLKIYDVTGRLVSEEQYELPAGNHSLPVNGSAWAAGTYFANVATEDAAQTVKMQLMK